jgi:hypothetical protein
MCVIGRLIEKHCVQTLLRCGIDKCSLTIKLNLTL